MTRFTAAASAALAMALLANASFAQQQTAPPPGGAAQLQPVASFEHPVTGVRVSTDGRIFVKFPRWTEDASISAAEATRDGQIKPYPDDASVLFAPVITNNVPLILYEDGSHGICTTEKNRACADLQVFIRSL